MLPYSSRSSLILCNPDDKSFPASKIAFCSVQLRDSPLGIAWIDHVHKPKPSGITRRGVLQHFGLIYRAELAKCTSQISS